MVDRSTLDTLEDLLTNFNRDHPNVLNEEAIEYILNAGSYKRSVITHLIWSAVASLFLVFIAFQPSEKTFILAAVLVFIGYHLWKAVTIAGRSSSGKRALDQAMQTSGIAEAKVQALRTAVAEIRSRRKKRLLRVERSSSSNFSITGCGGCGGGGGGCGGGGGSG